MKWWYHLETTPEEGKDDGICVNEENLELAIIKAKSAANSVIDYGLVCNFGDGLIHPLSDVELETLKAAFPELPERDRAGRLFCESRAQ